MFNVDRLLRDVDARLEHLPEEARRDVRDAIQEEAARARRRLDPSGTVENERERRLEAETLREVLEAINRQARLEDTLEETLRQLARVVDVDSCSIGLFDGPSYQILAAKGYPETARLVGLRFETPLVEEVRQRNWPASVPNVEEEPRWIHIEGSEPVRSWAGVPLLVEGQVIGILNLDRHRVDPFSDDDLHRARAVAFSAAAAIRNAQALEQIRGYADLMEQVVAVGQAVFARKPPEDVRGAVLAGAQRLGQYAGALLLEGGPDGAVVTAAVGALEAALGQTAPAELWASALRRIDARESTALAERINVAMPRGELLVVPLQNDTVIVATLAVLDVDGVTPADRLMEAYGSRTGSAYAHALSDG